MKSLGFAVALLLVVPSTAPGTAAESAPAPEVSSATEQVGPFTQAAASVPRKCLKRVPARGFARGQNAQASRPAQLRTWSYVGPRAELGRGKVSVRDRAGCVLVRGRTNRQGTFTAALPHRRSLRMPLTVVVRDGRAAG